MNAKIHRISLGLAASVAILAAIPTAQAADGAGKYGSIYAVDPYGTVVRDPYGRCIRTPQWTPEKDAVECGAIAKAPPPQVVTKTISLETDAFFDFDKATLKPTGMTKLDQLVEDMRQAENVNAINIIGHTDSIGTEAYNQRLSERRAATVRNYLVEKGVNPGIITASGLGESQPVTPNTLPNGRDNPEGRAKNRRVDVTIDALQTVKEE